MSSDAHGAHNKTPLLRPRSREAGAHLRVSDSSNVSSGQSSRNCSRPHSRETVLPNSRPASRPGLPTGERIQKLNTAREIDENKKAGAGRAAPASTTRPSHEELLGQVANARVMTDLLGTRMRKSLDEMQEMMREKDRGKKPIEQLRSAFPAKLDKFSDSWLQCEDLEAVRTEIDHEADVQGVHRYEDESSAIDRCRYKYNPVGELERYLPSIGVRAILTHRGVAVEILGDPRDVDAAKRWHRRVRLEGLAASCGPMDRPESTKNVEAFRFARRKAAWQQSTKLNAAQLHRKRLSMSVATEVSDTADAESSNANPFRGKHGVAYGHFRPAELELLHKDHE